MRWLYSFFIILYVRLLAVAALVSPRAAAWIRGRGKLTERMRAARIAGKPVVWFHCASLGEFEQGRPLIERFKEQYPACQVLLTFYSPSGYEVRKNYAGADHVFYLPADTISHARRFLDIWNPELAVFVKYEYWYNFLHVMHQRKIPVLFVSALFRPNQHFFRNYGFWFRRHLKDVHHFFVQNQSSVQLLNQAGIKQVSLSGDTRFDRVAAIARQPVSFDLIEAFTGSHPVMIAGSTWPADEALIASVFAGAPASLKLVIAPHEISEAGLARLEGLFPAPVQRFTALKGRPPAHARVLIIDTIGMLSHIYQYGNLAYIGGGFGKGIHNILEAAVFGMPVFFGPRYRNFGEAVELVQKGGAFPVPDAEAFLQKLLGLFADESEWKKVSGICSDYVKESQGATEQIMQFISKLIIKK